MTKPASELIALADDYLRNGAAESGAHELIRQLADCLRTAANQSGSERAGVDALREALTNGNHYLCAIRQRLERLYEEHPNDGALRGHISDEVDWIDGLRDALATPPAQPAPAGDTITGTPTKGNAIMTDDQIKYMVDRFLMWKLPEHFNPDCGISFDPKYRDEHSPVGTNLLDATQATDMVRYMLDGMSDHGKPDGAVREALDDIQSHHNSWRQIMEDMRDHQSRCREPDDEKYIQHEIDVLDRVAAALQSKIVPAETSPGDVVAISPPVYCRCYDDTSRKFCLDKDRCVQPSIALAAIDRLDVKAEAKSQEPVAVANAPHYLASIKSRLHQLYNMFPTDARLREQISDEVDWIEELEAHPTTKPEAPAVSVDAIKDIAAERQRQISVEGWTAAHDDGHVAGEMATAAAAYIFADQRGVAHTVDGNEYLVDGRELWPWDLDWWKPKNHRANLVRSGALIVAEIERLDRAALIAGER